MAEDDEVAEQGEAGHDPPNGWGGVQEPGYHSAGNPPAAQPASTWTWAPPRHVTLHKVRHLSPPGPSIQTIPCSARDMTELWEQGPMREGVDLGLNLEGRGSRSWHTRTVRTSKRRTTGMATWRRSRSLACSGTGGRGSALTSAGLLILLLGQRPHLGRSKLAISKTTTILRVSWTVREGMTSGVTTTRASMELMTNLYWPAHST